MGFSRRQTWYIKLTNIEFWPSWIFYIPVWIQHFWLAVKTRNFFFFLETNPAIDGFILSDSKFKTLQLVPASHRPNMVFVPAGAEINDVLAQLQRKGISFPIILKPDIGFRGLKVVKLDDVASLTAALPTLKVHHIIQEFIPHALEAGIFYFRYPNERHGSIPSVTIKSFLEVVGDGQQTLEELVTGNPRALLHERALRQRFATTWTTIVPKSEVLVLEEIGNHSRGTRFINGNDLVDEALLAVFDKLSHQMNGFYFGRFDIKVASFDDLRKGENYTILEVNGVGGEPTHIYDPNTKLLQAWNDLCFTWRVAAKIAKINFQQGCPKPTYAVARTKWKDYLVYRTKLNS